MSLLKLKQLDQSGATDGQVAVWNNATGLWEPSTAVGKASFSLILTRRNNGVSAGTYLRSSDAMPLSTSPFVMPFAGTLTTLTASSSDTSKGAWGVEVLKNDVSAIILSGALNVLKIYNLAAGVSFVQGDEIKVRLDPTPNNDVGNPIALLIFMES